MQPIPFTKMHGLGNDFVVIDRRNRDVALDAELITWIADRHRGIGFDQLVVIDPAKDADASITFYNNDGTTAGACGNGTRCAARLLMDDMAVEQVTFASPGGAIKARRLGDGIIEVAMPAPRLAWNEIPLSKPCDTLHMPIDLFGLPEPAGVSMGNPHAVFFVQDVDGLDILAMGPVLEHHPLFPDRANIGFAEVRSRQVMRLRVFERGAGLTLACGSGACAAHVAARRRGLVDPTCRLLLDGGELSITWGDSGPVIMTGAAAYSFKGVLPDGVADGPR